MSGRRLALAAVAVLSVGVALYALVFYTVFRGALGAPPTGAFEERPWVLWTHATAGAVALLLGPLQFSRRLRARRPDLHRRLGKVYLGVGMLVGGLAGLWLALTTVGGWVARAGFTGLALGWLATAWFAWRTARRRDFTAHRRWVTRSFALTFAAVTLRLQLPVAEAFGLSFLEFYPAVAWTCWVPNALAVEAWLRWRRLAPVDVPAAVG